MIKRLSWFVGGAVVGVASASYAKRKVKATAAQLAPANVAKSAVAKVKAKGHDVVDAVREGREAMHAKETELRSRLEPGDNSEVAQVIVLRGVSVTEFSGTSSGSAASAVIEVPAATQPGPRRASRRRRRAP